MLPLLVGRKLDSSTDSFQTLTDRLNTNTSRRSSRSNVKYHATIKMIRNCA